MYFNEFQYIQVMVSTLTFSDYPIDDSSKEEKICY